MPQSSSITNASSPSSSSATATLAQPAAAAPVPQTPSSRMSEHQMNVNIERNHRTLPPQFHSSSPSKYPSIPRFTPAIPSRMGGNYTPNAQHGSGSSSNNNNGGTSSSSYTHNSNGYNHRIGTSSASSSPPGTPPSGLRNYYLNAAYQRSQHHIYSKGSSALPSNSSSQQQQRPAMSTGAHQHQQQQYGARVQVPEAAVARRSYSADHLQVPETDFATGGTLQSTENHVMTLQRALSRLVEKNEQDEGDDEENKDRQPASTTTTRGENTPTTKIGSNSSSSSSTPPGTPPHRKGVTKYPKVELERVDPEKAAVITSISGESDITLAPPTTTTTTATATEISKDTQQQEKEKPKKKTGRKDGLDLPLPATTPVSTDLRRQPSKAGVLSNLLKLQGIGRQQKQHRAPKVKATKEKRRPTMYSRSANVSTASLTTKSVFGTYPPLPATPSQQQQQGSTSLSIFHPSPRNSNNGNTSGTNSNRQSAHFDNVIAQSFSVMNSPFQSPNISPRGSISGGENTPNGFYFTPVANGTTSPNSPYGVPLSNEEKMQITIAVADILERQDFILRLAKSLIKYGAPSHRLEDAVDHAAKTLEINLQCIYLPNVMIVSFTDYETHTSETHLLKVPAGLDMYKCALVHQVQKMVTHSSMPVEEAIMKLDAINTEKDANGRWITVLAYAVSGFCTAPMFFRGNWIDATISFFMGAAVGLLVWLSEKVPSYAHICDVTMSVVVAFVAEALRHHNVCTSAIKFAGIVIILPGYTITCSILELSSRHIISGSVRLFYAVIFSLLLGYGLTIGASLWSLFDHSKRDDESKFSAECPNAPLNPLWNILFVPFFAISLNIWLKAHPRQWFLATVLSIVGYTVSYTSSVYGGAKTEVSSALAAFAIGLCGNIYQRLTRQLTFQAVVCAVFFLVPGSIGLKGAMAWFTEDMSGGINFALQMVVTAIAISVGLFTSALAVYPMGKIRSAQMTF
ncbi:hypothetical protein BG015_012047 [Linnemannia schmuckeri]|uniref:DUF1212-domain-containing protein n=1 Tax=Linnemannia schmuckeri TaxID=64567 RepID=A0A9P5RV83_9FUNG|nr:hypothetical protein BG015_012047 [Linnemannia schmuckeri]